MEDIIQQVMNIFESDDGKTFAEKKQEAIAFLEAMQEQAEPDSLKAKL